MISGEQSSDVIFNLYVFILSPKITSFTLTQKGLLNNEIFITKSWLCPFNAAKTCSFLSVDYMEAVNKFQQGIAKFTALEVIFGWSEELRHLILLKFTLD